MDNVKHYSDYFFVPKDYRANMTREALEETPNFWLQFYPHPKYVQFLKTVLSCLDGDNKTVWLTGNYGTGKSFAALVTQKLFMEDEAKVNEWFSRHHSRIDDADIIKKALFARRTENTLVIYDYNAQGVGPNEEFLVRVERSIVSALNAKGFIVPLKANLSEIIERIKEEGASFLKTRDSIQDRLSYLNSSYGTIDQIVAELTKPITSDDSTTSGLLGDIQRVLHERNIYLDLTVPRFRAWLDKVLAENGIRRIIYIFDEFSKFIENNKTDLKTFEEVAEVAGKFFFIPVTHLSINAYWSEDSASAKKANGRFYFRELEMLPDVAFQLAAAALQPYDSDETKAEWQREKSELLWNAISDFAGIYFTDKDVSRQSLFDILPLHPMAAFLLKFLSTSAGENQRSIFEYLKGSANGCEFQDFIKAGGPNIRGKQFLTVDYLWKYFIERDDLGLSKEVREIRGEFERIKNKEFLNRDEDDVEIRVLKTILLFCLLNRLNPDGHDRLRPTVQNIELSFRGDGSIVDVNGIVRELAEKHCFSIVNDNIEMFSTSVGGAELDKEIAKYETEFHNLLCKEEAKKALFEHTKGQRGSFSGGRFDIRVSDIDHIGAQYFTDPARRQFASDVNATDSATQIWFVVAKNNIEQLKIPEKITKFLDQFKEHRIICITFPKTTFCGSNADNWKEYVALFAKYSIELDTTLKQQGKIALDKIKNVWLAELKRGDQELKVYCSSHFDISSPPIVWAGLKNILGEFILKALPYCPDNLTSQIKSYDILGLRGWALAGITFDAPSNASGAPMRQLISALKNTGVSLDEKWFEQNPNHILTAIYELFKKKIANTIGKGSSLSIRKAYIDLQRAPYGLKHNALSSFVLGFVLKDLISKNYQWSNGAMTRPLHAETLAEIIESVVKNDGNGEIRGEKLICKISKQEKDFIQYAPKMFGDTTPADDDRTVENALILIEDRIKAISARVPLWVLPPYINSLSDPQSEIIEEAIGNVCAALVNSSKAQEDRIVAVKRVGEIIASTPGIVECIADYIKTEHFAAAFSQYVDKAVPELRQLAESIGDLSGAFLDSIKDKARETAGWLWKATDIGVDIESTKQEYEAIRELLNLTGISGFRQFGDLVGILKNTILTNNKLPRSILTAEHPSLVGLISQITNDGGYVGLSSNIKINADLLKKLFFETSLNETLRILHNLNGAAEHIPNRELITIYKSLNAGFYSPESVFLSEFNSKIDEWAKNSVARKIKTEWQRISGSNSPDEWALANNLPARFALGNAYNYSELLNAIDEPAVFSAVKLADILSSLENLLEVKIDDAQKEFLKETIPNKYLKFNISFASLVQYMSGKFGKQPNRWSKRPPDIEEFIREQYKLTFASQVAERIRGAKADDIKERLYKYAKDNPDLGLLFWE